MNFAELLDKLLKLLVPVYILLGGALTASFIWRAMEQIARSRARKRTTGRAGSRNARDKWK